MRNFDSLPAHPMAERAALTRAQAWRGKAQVAGLIVILCLSGLNTIYRKAIAQERTGQYPPAHGGGRVCAHGRG